MDLLAARIPGLVTVLPTVPHVAGRVREAASGWPTPLHILESEADKYAAFDAANVALAASGTVTAELALARTPMVVAYRVGGLTYALANRLMTVPYMTLVNILLERRAIPEFKQYDAKPEILAAEVERLFRDRGARARRRWRPWMNSGGAWVKGKKLPRCAPPVFCWTLSERGPPKCEAVRVRPRDH